MFLNVTNPTCKLSSESATMTLSSAKCRVFILVVVEKVVPFVSVWVHFAVISFMVMLNTAGDKGQPCLAP